MKRQPAAPTTPRSPRVAVVGGGLAGIAAALRCADAGREVVLLESRPSLGGLTHSFRRGDLWVDNGQHVFMRCCTSYRELLDRLGVAGMVTLQHRLDVPVRSARDRRTGRLRRTSMPAPLHLASALARYRWLSPAERVRVVTAALALGRVDRDAPHVDRRTFGDWLAARGQSDRAVEAVWDLIGVATLNARASEASLALAATVFQIGLLGSASAADLGWSRVPLRRLHGDAASAALTAAGVAVHTRSKVEAVGRAGDDWVVRAAGESFGVEDVVLAVPPWTAARLAPAGAVPLPPGWADELGSTPIVNLHVVYDRPVLDEPFVAVVDSPLQWVFDRTAQAGLRHGQYVAVSLSAADALVDLPVSELRARFLPELDGLLNPSGAARALDFFVTRERAATFSSEPGVAGRRPPVRTELAGLHLAGAWTDTGWPATMEGAVRSGNAAASVVLERTGRPREVVA